MPLSCPDGANFAAVAKQLHETALEVEARIFGLEQLLRGAANRATLMQTTTAAKTGIPTGLADTHYFGSFGGSPVVTNFNNTQVTSDNVDGNFTFLTLGAGVYEVGVSATAIPSGAVTDNSQRVWRIQQLRPDFTTATGTVLIHEASILQFEPNTGIGVDVCIVGTFRMRAADRIRFTLSHDNASSLTVSSGVVMWLHHLSDANTLSVI